MDPQAALDAAEQEIEAGEYREALEHLNHYTNWRARGGFEPEDGDQRSREMRDQLRSLGPDDDWGDDDDDAADICLSCSGSGEGMADGTVCSMCKGKGVRGRENQEEE